MSRASREKYYAYKAYVEGTTAEHISIAANSVAMGSEGVMDEDGEDGGSYMVRSERGTPPASMHSARTEKRTTIDDFEIINPISKGAYGRVFLAKKKTTGDLFAIKVRVAAGGDCWFKGCAGGFVVRK